MGGVAYEVTWSKEKGWTPADATEPGDVSRDWLKGEGTAQDCGRTREQIDHRPACAPRRWGVAYRLPGRAPSPRRSPSESRCFCPLQAFVHGQYLVLVDFVLTLALYLGPLDHGKAREFQKNIYFCFIDYAKAFDCVDTAR